MESRQTVLVVDDHPETRAAVSTVVTKMGHEVKMATDGREALDLLELTPPAAIISDFTMPGLNGLEMLRILRERRISVPVIWMTGYGAPDVYREALAAGVYDILVKPISAQGIRDCLTKALAFGVDYNERNVPGFVARTQCKELLIGIERENLQLILEMSKSSGLSATTLINQMIARSMRKAA